MALLPSLRSLSAYVLVAVLATVQPSRASPSIGAWWTSQGPQLLVQNETTSAIQYSYCNSNGTPIYPVDNPNILTFESGFKPRNGTALTGVGWWDSQTTTASIWFQDEDLSIVNSLLKCDWTTGQFSETGSWVVSNSSPDPHPETGLSSLLLGSSAGYRVYYHDQNMTVHEISYTTDDGWFYGGQVTADRMATTAIGSQFSSSNDKANITVIAPRDAENMETARLNSDDSWHIATFPRPLDGNLTTSVNANSSAAFALNTTAITNFTLPALGSPKSVGLSIDSQYTRYVWYIGSDRQLYSAASRNFTWGLDESQSTLFWPEADESNAHMGITSDASSSQVCIYYFVKSNLTEIKLTSSGRWQEAASLQTFNATAPAPEPTTAVPSNSTATGGPGSEETEKAGGLSSGAKTGLGVGLTLGVLAVAGLVGFFLYRRRAAAKNREQQNQVDPSSAPGTAGSQPVAYDVHGNPLYSSPPGVDGYTWDNKQPPASQIHEFAHPAQQLDGRGVYQELEGPKPMYELPDQTYSHELIGNQRVEHELPETSRPTKP